MDYEYRTLVTLRVHNEGDAPLVYTFHAIEKAAEMMRFLREFFPAAEFSLEPAHH